MQEKTLEIKTKKPFNWKSLSIYIFYGLAFLLPLFFLPLAVGPFNAAKAFLFYTGISLAFIFWLFDCLQKGRVQIPKSRLLLALGGVILAWFVSSVFSLNPAISLTGMGYEIGTFVFFLFCGLAVFLIATLFADEQRVAIFYLLLLLSSFLVFIFQLFHTVFGLTLLSSNIFRAPTDNLLGGWNDFAIFFGFIALTSVCFFEMSRFKRAIKGIFLASVLLSILAMLAVNFFIAWIIFGFFILVFLVYFLSASFYSHSSSEEGGSASGSPTLSTKIITLPLFILLIVIFFVLARGLLGDFTGTLHTSVTEVGLSWNSTFSIAKHVLKENPILGSGPNTFLYDWLKYKPASVNSTMFWSVRFHSGISYLFSMVSTAGALGALALLSFLGFLLYYGTKVLSYFENDIKKVMLITSFLGSLYLWSFVVFYSPGFLIFALAFLMTGILVAMLTRVGKIKMIEINFSGSPRLGFISVLVIIILMIGMVSSLYLFSRKYWALHSYTQALEALNIEGNLDKSEAALIKAANMDAQDQYFRSLAEIGILRMKQVLSQKDLSKEILRSKFQNIFGKSIQNAQRATKLNPNDPLNWMELARVYESVVPFGISGSGDFAIKAYQKVAKVSPLDPRPYLGMARVSLASKDVKKAREYIQASLKIKSDFAAALFMLSQIEAKEGNLKKAIQRAEQTVFIVPNDIGALFQLGLLNYQDKNYSRARAAFERIISLNPGYANANYFLGLIYDKQGKTKKSIKVFEEIEKSNPDNKEVKLILKNLRGGREALSGISPPNKSPEKRKEPPVKDAKGE